MATASEDKKYNLISTSSEVEVCLGDDIILPCLLSPETSAVAMEIRWFKGTECIYLYKKGQVSVGRGFEGRVATNMLKRGDVSLTLRNGQWGDEDQYTCQVIHREHREERRLILQYEGERGVICADSRKITDRHLKRMAKSVQALEEWNRQRQKERGWHQTQQTLAALRAYRQAQGGSIEKSLVRLSKNMERALENQIPEEWKALQEKRWKSTLVPRREHQGHQSIRSEKRLSRADKQKEDSMEKRKDNTEQQQEDRSRQDNIKMLLQQVLLLETELQARDGKVKNLKTQLQEQKSELKERDKQLRKNNKQLEGKCKQRKKSTPLSKPHTFQDRGRHNIDVDPPSMGGVSSGRIPTELRLVLLGWSAAEKRAAGDTILGPHTLTHTSTETQHSETRQGEVAGRQVTLVETPDWFCSGLSEKDMRQDVGLCVHLSAPGPHAFLLVISVEPSEGEERRMLEKMEDIFGEGCWGHTLILFTHAEGQRERSVEELLQTGNQELQQLVEKCGNRCHLLSVKDRPDDTKITQLLEKIEEMGSGNRERFYSSDTYQEAERQIREIEGRIDSEWRKWRERKEREMKSTHEMGLENRLKKMHGEIQDREGKILAVEKRIAELDKRLEDKMDEEKRRELGRRLEEEKEKKTESEMEIKRLNDEFEEEKREMVEMRESYERETRAAAKRSLMKIILPELQRNISITKESMEAEYKRYWEEKNRQMQEKNRQLKKKSQQMDQKNQELKIIVEKLQKEKAIHEQENRQSCGEKSVEVPMQEQQGRSIEIGGIKLILEEKDREMEKIKQTVVEKGREMETMKQIVVEREREMERIKQNVVEREREIGRLNQRLEETIRNMERTRLKHEQESLRQNEHLQQVTVKLNRDTDTLRQALSSFKDTQALLTEICKNE